MKQQDKIQQEIKKISKLPYPINKIYLNSYLPLHSNTFFIILPKKK